MISSVLPALRLDSADDPLLLDLLKEVSLSGKVSPRKDDVKFHNEGAEIDLAYEFFGPESDNGTSSGM